jgi:bla regulator protein BlaR1
MMNGVTNHLWQSTVFAVAVTVLAFALRKNSARVRFAIWFSASIKFLIPFSLLISAGGLLQETPPIREIMPPAVSLRMMEIAQPFPEVVVEAPRSHRPADWKPVVFLVLWSCGFCAIALMRIRGWLRVRTAMRAGDSLELGRVQIPVRSCPGLLEPGVVGWLHPMLLLPSDIRESLIPAQLDAVIAHELCHISRRDNLTSAIHMLVETLFWFHPLVWWIGARLLEERELACDEEVLRTAADAKTYADAILAVCKRYVESPLACVAGVSGADLKKRIEAIMTDRIVLRLNFAKKAAIGAASAAAVALPVLVGMMRTSYGQPQLAFETISIKTSTSADHRRFFNGPDASGGQFTAANATVRSLIRLAYDVKDFQIEGAPDWTGSTLFDIAAKLPGPTDRSQFRLMLQSLLADRFHLAVRRETKAMPGYSLTIADYGLKIKEAHDSDPAIPQLAGRKDLPVISGRPSVSIVRRGRLITQSANMAGVAGHLSETLGQTVTDATHLTGIYDLNLEWAPDQIQIANFQAMGVPEGFGAPPPGWQGPTLFAAVEDQLGLKLIPTQAPQEFLMVDHVEQPPAN